MMRICNDRILKKFCLFVCFSVSVLFLIANVEQYNNSSDKEVIIENTNFWNGADAISWMAEMSARMIERQHHLQQKCSYYNLDNTNVNDSLHRPNTWEYLINRPYHLVWCNVFKAASTSWMYNFNILAGYKPQHLQRTKEVPLQLARKKYPRPTLEELKTALNESISFLIVRHPLERLLSGYRDKIEHSLAHTYHRKLGLSIINTYRKQNRRRFIPTYPTFSEFVQFVVDNYKKGLEFDMHWAPITTFCTPCQIDIKIIMKFETLQDDQNFLIHLAKLDKIIRPQWKNPSKGKSNTISSIKTYYSQLTMGQINQLYDIYRYDFELFNYTLDGYVENVQDDKVEVTKL